VKDTPHGKRPQAIAHRGYKAANPENTMGAFKGAADVGAHAIETDLHLSKDGVVVLSHVRTFQRNGRKPGQSLLNIGCYSQTLLWKG
jgi:phosphatidylglycerol phospholipase C